MQPGVSPKRWHSQLWFLWICVSQMRLLKQHKCLVTQSRGVCSVWRTAYTLQRGECLWRGSTGHMHREENISYQEQLPWLWLDIYFHCHIFFPPRFFFLSFKGQILLILKVMWCFRYHLQSLVCICLYVRICLHPFS